MCNCLMYVLFIVDFVFVCWYGLCLFYVVCVLFC